VLDEHRFSVLGGDAEAVSSRLATVFIDDASLKVALQSAISSLGGSERELANTDLEVAVLERNGRRRCFRRIDDTELTNILA